MAASMQQQYLPKQTVKSVLYGNVLKIGISSLFLITPFYFGPFLSLVQNNDTAIKILILSVFILEVLFRVILPADKSLLSKGTDVIKYILIILISCIFYFYTSIVYGAPFLSKINETLHFSALLTTTTVIPLCLNLGPDINIWIKSLHLHSTDESSCLNVVYSITCMSSLFGAWLGAFPIPLDWDRPWQIWPISCVIGNILGYITGAFLSSIYILFKYRQLNKLKLT